MARVDARTFARLSPVDRASFLADLSELEAAHLLYDWRFWARPEQIAPETPWETWLVLAGRGFGKTRTGAEWVRTEAESGRRRRIALVGPTLRDVKKTMVEGEAGVIGISPPWFRPLFVKSELRLVWPNGTIADLYSAERPDRLRGPSHDAAWADELAAWKHLEETWDNLELTLRGGSDPKRVVTTTPKPRQGLKRLMLDPTTIVTRGSTSANADNLAKGYVTRLQRRYAGTRLGRQELEAEVLEEAEGALWSLKRLDQLRVAVPPDLKRVVVAVDPAVSTGSRSAETGIVVAGTGADGVGYVLADLSGRRRPEEWAARAIAAFRAHRADRINGNTYTEAMFAGNGYADALPKLLRDVASHTAQLYQSPSATSILVSGSGDVALTVAANKTFARGQPIRIARTSDPAAVWMTGTCLDYAPGTGVLTVKRSDALGSGTYADWTVSVDGGAGPEGPAGPIGTTPLIATSTTATLTIQLGATPSFVTAADLPLLPGGFVLMTATADPTKWMAGQIATKSGTTLTVDVQATNGTGSHAGWTVQLVGPRGIQGPTGPAGGLSLAQAHAVALSF